MISNSSTQVAFGVNDYDTAELLAKRIGQTTVETRSEGVSQSSGALLRHQAQEGQAETGRWLIDASEILRMEASEALVFMGRTVRAPIRAKRLLYYKDSRFAGLFDEWRGASYLALTFQPRLLDFQPRLVRHQPDLARAAGQQSDNVIPFPQQKVRNAGPRLTATASAASIKRR